MKSCEMEKGESPKDEMEHSEGFLEKAMKMKKGKEVSAKLVNKKQRKSGGGGKSFSSGKGGGK